MGLAKGILPHHEDKEPLSDPASSGFFVAVTLAPDLSRDGLVTLLKETSAAIDTLTSRDKDGGRVASVAVGFAPSLFVRGGAARFNPPLQVPAAFAADVSLPTVPAGASIGADLLFYVVTPIEARANAFLAALWALRPSVAAITVERGFQRSDGTEPFGYADGLRNVARDQRSGVVYASAQRHLEEPEGAIGGSYMAVMKITQNADAFDQLDATAQDQVIGRERDGTRLDLVGQKVSPREEPSTPVPTTPPNGHVPKAGPRGTHDDNMIFRRGMPFSETLDGQVRIGLQFCSFQASLDQFDVIWSDWIMNPQFNAQPGGPAAGVDALLDPTRGLTTIEKFGFFFVPPSDDKKRFIGATLLDEPAAHKPKKTGRVAIRKRVVAATDASARFERQGFQFQIIDANNQVVETLTTDSAGHAQSGELAFGANYTLRESATPAIPNIQTSADIPFTLDTPNKVLRVTNTVTQPGGYGAP